jgi:hypothetical protein
MIIWPRRGPDDPGEAVERLSGRRGAVLRLNAATLAACAALLALAPTAGGAVVVAPGLDPTVDAGVLAWAQQDGSVLVRDGSSDYSFPQASSPSLDGELLAYIDADGIRIVRWQTGEEVRRLRTNATAVALDWPLVAFRREDARRRRLILRNLDNGSRSAISRTLLATDLGRPSLGEGKLAWHVSNRNGSRISLLYPATGRRRTIARTKIGLLLNPAVHGRRIVWVSQRSGSARIKMRYLASGSTRTIARLTSRDLGFWSTALVRHRVYATRWSLRTRAATIYSFGY